MKLVCLKSLRTLVILHNNFSQDSTIIKYKILRILPRLAKIDKKPVSVSEVEAAAMKYDSQANEESTCDEEQENDRNKNVLVFKYIVKEINEI